MLWRRQSEYLRRLHLVPHHDIACWIIDTAYNDESFFVRHAYFTGADEPYEKLKRALRVEIVLVFLVAFVERRRRGVDTQGTPAERTMGDGLRAARRGRRAAVSKWRPALVADSGSMSEQDLDAYIASRGAAGKSFSIFCVESAALQTKLDTASGKGRELGLMLDWSVDDTEVQRPEHVRHPETSTALAGFLTKVIGRRDEATDPAGAQSDLCTPLAVGVFFYDDKLNGISTHLHASTCLDGSAFPGDGISGVTFKDRIPDAIWKYVPIHELGHYFGLCHTDGLDRVMYSAAEKSWWDWTLVAEYLWLSGEPQFTLDEAKRTWDYIVANFSAACLSARRD